MSIEIHPEPHVRRQQQTVDEIMSPHVIATDSDSTIGDAMDTMDRFSVHHLVVEDRGKFVGVVSDRDLLRHISPFAGTINERPRDATTLHQRLFAVATYHPISVETGTPLAEAAGLLLQRDISCLPVLGHDGRVIGVLTSRDLVRGLVHALEQGICELPHA